MSHLDHIPILERDLSWDTGLGHKGGVPAFWEFQESWDRYRVSHLYVPAFSSVQDWDLL